MGLEEQIDFGVHSEIGKSHIDREMDGEDSTSFNDSKGIFLLADGMGGIPNPSEKEPTPGKDSSYTAVIEARKFLEEPLTPGISELSDDEFINYMADVIEYANGQVLRMMHEKGHVGVGATLEIACIDAENNRIGWAHNGDSRQYYITEEDIEQMTEDEDVPSRGIGRSNDPGVESGVVYYNEGDKWLMLSDGLYRGENSPIANMNNEIKEILYSDRNSMYIADDLIKIAKEVGSTDDLTCMLFTLPYTPDESDYEDEETDCEEESEEAEQVEGSEIETESYVSLGDALTSPEVQSIGSSVQDDPDSIIPETDPDLTEEEFQEDEEQETTPRRKKSDLRYLLVALGLIGVVVATPYFLPEKKEEPQDNQNKANAPIIDMPAGVGDTEEKWIDVEEDAGIESCTDFVDNVPAVLRDSENQDRKPDAGQPIKGSVDLGSIGIFPAESNPVQIPQEPKPKPAYCDKDMWQIYVPAFQTYSKAENKLDRIRNKDAGPETKEDILFNLNGSVVGFTKVMTCYFGDTFLQDAINEIKSNKKLSKNYRLMANGGYDICRKSAYFNALAHRNMANVGMDHEAAEYQWRSIALFHIYNSLERNPDSKFAKRARPKIKELEKILF